MVSYLHIKSVFVLFLTQILFCAVGYAQNDSLPSKLGTLVELEYAEDTIFHYGYISDSAYVNDTSIQFQVRPGYHVVYRPDSSIYMKGSWEVSPEKTIVRHDTFYYYYPNGSLRDIGPYVYGQRSGNWKHYHEDGKLFYIQNHNNKHREYYTKKGKLRAEGPMHNRDFSDRFFEYRNLIFHVGFWKFYGYDEKCACKGYLVNDQKVKEWTYYSVNRKDKIKMEYSKPKSSNSYNFLQSCLWR